MGEIDWRAPHVREARRIHGGIMELALQGEAEVPIEQPKPRKVWRWESIGGLALINGYRLGAELGVSSGRFTWHLCGWMHDMHMIAVDLWEGKPKSEIEGSETYEGRDHEAFYQRFKQVCAEYFPGRVHIRRMDTVEAAKTVTDGSLDFVFIDADHTEAGCARDIDAWYPKIRRGGLISGHDINWDSVRRAVESRFGGEYDVFPSDNVWWKFVL
jgi:hypothetical protein